MKQLSKKKSVFIVILCCIWMSDAILAQDKSIENTSTKNKMTQLIDKQFNFAVQQYEYLEKNCPRDSMPKTFINNRNINSDIYWWCSGFYPGSLLYIYEYTKNPTMLSIAKKKLKILEPLKTFTETHDIGFMMNCSFGNAYRLFGKPEDKAILITSASSLATRYRPSIKAIQSWDVSNKEFKDFKCPVIIDNMMNLELLCWVSDNGADSKFKEIAVTHANTTMQNHFRPDYSSYQVVDYDPTTGKVLRKVTFQGTSDSSAWSRGQAWGLYGYVVMYRFTKDKKYLVQAKNIANFILNNPNLPADKIPYWDFDAPTIPNALRDSSAGAIIASALLELGQYSTKKEKKEYVAVAEKMIQSLASDKYRAKLGENGGFLLMHGVGNMPANSEIDVPLTYADYYYLEALLRYKKWYL